MSEVQTGGASASDEFVELTNAGPAAVDLVGLEIVYVTSTGGTVTRKAAWTASLLLEPGRHLLVANSAGTYASIADATYSGGFAATGGAIVLRVVGGAPIDAIGWGDATNAFVEGLPAPAPAADSSLERRPGGLAGNGSDTNDNVADWLVQSSPSPQNLAAPPLPAPGASPTPLITPPPTPSAQPTAGPTASPTDDARSDREPIAAADGVRRTDPVGERRAQSDDERRSHRRSPRQPDRDARTDADAARRPLRRPRRRQPRQPHPHRPRRRVPRRPRARPRRRRPRRRRPPSQAPRRRRRLARRSSRSPPPATSRSIRTSRSKEH